MARKENNKVTSSLKETINRTQGEVNMPGGNKKPEVKQENNNAVSGDLSTIVDEIKNSLKRIDEWKTRIFSADGKSDNPKKNLLNIERRSLMAFLSGQTISEVKDFEATQTYIVNFHKKIANVLDGLSNVYVNTNDINSAYENLASGSINVVLTNDITKKDNKDKDKKDNSKDVLETNIFKICNDIEDNTKEQLEYLKKVFGKLINKKGNQVTQKNKKSKVGNDFVKLDSSYIEDLKDVIIENSSKKTVEKISDKDGILSLIANNIDKYLGDNNEVNIFGVLSLISDKIDEFGKNINIPELTISEASIDNIVTSIENVKLKLDLPKIEISDNSKKSIENLVKSINNLQTSVSNIKDVSTRLPQDIIRQINSLGSITTSDSQIKRTAKYIKTYNDEFFSNDGVLRQLLKNINGLNFNSKNLNIGINNLNSLLQILPSIGNIDKESMKLMKKNLYQLYWMTTKSNILTKVGITSKGIISAIIENIKARSEDVNNGGVKNFANIMGYLVKLIELYKDKSTEKSLDSTKHNLHMLAYLYCENGPVSALFEELKNLGDYAIEENLYGSKDNKTHIIQETIVNAGIVDRKILLKDILESTAKVQLILFQTYLYRKIIKSLSKLNTKSLETTKNKRIPYLFDIIKHFVTINPKDLDNVINSTIKLNDILIISAIGGMLSKSGIYGLQQYVKVLDEFQQLDAILTLFNKETSILFARQIKSLDEMKTIIKSLTEICIMASVGLMFAKIGSLGLKQYSGLTDSIKDLVKKISGEDFNISTDVSANIERSKNIIADLTIISMLGAIGGIIAPLAIIGFKGMSMSVNSLSSIISKLEAIDIKEDTVKKLKGIGITVGIATGVLIFAAITGKYVMRMAPEILGFSIMLSLFILGVTTAYNIGTTGIEDSMESADKFGKLLMISGLTMLAGAGFMFIPYFAVAALGFALTLSAFIFGVTLAYTQGTKNIEKTVDLSDSVMNLVIKSGLILALGGIITNKYGWWKQVGFLVSLSLLIGGVMLAYSYSSSKLKETTTNAKDFAYLIGISAASLTLPTLIMGNHPGAFFGNALLFSLNLGLFVLLVKAAYGMGDILGALGAGAIAKIPAVGKIVESSSNDKGTKKTIDDAKEFAILVGVSGATLMLGAIMNEKFDGFCQSLEFATSLGLFIVGVSLAYSFGTKILDGKGMRDAHELTELVAISAGCLFIGGLFMMIDGMSEAVTNFAWLLGRFTILVALAYSGAGRLIGKNGIAIGHALSVLVAVSAITLLTAGMLMMIYPDLEDNIRSFMVCELILVGGMSLFLGLLSTFGKNLKTGALALIGIIFCIGLSGLAMQSIAKLTDDINKAGGFDSLWDTILSMFGVLMAFALGAIGLGAIIDTGIGGVALAGGIAALGSIIACVYLAGKAMQEIVKVMKLAAEVKEIDSDIMISNIESMLKIVWALKPFMNPLLDLIIATAAGTVASLGHMISKMSQGIQDYANLNIPIYGENGKIIARRTLNAQDFQDAADNISTIITIIGNSIVTTYKGNEELFSNGLVGDMLGMDTPFTRVVKSCTGMGIMISKIAQSVKDVAELRVPIYKGTDVVGYRKLKDSDFKNAADNTKQIIETLGSAIIETYKGNEKLFTNGSFGDFMKMDTPFTRVVKSCTSMGRMIYTISKGVKDVAELRIPIYDKDGKEVGSRSLGVNDFIMAGINTGLIITTLGNAIMGLADNKNSAWMFEDQSVVFKDGTCTRFSQVMTSLRGIGSLMSETVKGVKDVAQLKIQAYKSDGTIDKGKYIDLNPNDIKPNGKVYKNAQAIMTVIPNAIMAVYNSNPDWFEDTGWFTNDGSTSPFAIVKYLLENTGKLVSGSVDSLKQINDFKSKITNFTELDIFVKNVISSVPSAIMEAATEDGQGKELKPFFEDSKENIKKIGNSYKAYVSLIESIVKPYTSIFDLYKSMGDYNKDWKNIKVMIDGMLVQLPFSIQRGINEMPVFDKESKRKSIDKVKEEYQKYIEIISTCINAYSDISKFKEKIIDASKDEISITSLSEIPNEMIRQISSMFTKYANAKLNEAIKDFSPSMRRYREGMFMLFDVYNEAPKSKDKYMNVLNTVKGINTEIANISNTEAFKTETEDVSKFTKSINSLDLTRTQAMTSLVNALNAMATKLGGLDKLTDALANKLALVLDKLVAELKLSAKTINKADEIQQKRHAAIKKSILEISTLINKPVEVVVQQKETNMEYQYSTQDVKSDTSNTGSHSDESSPGSGGTTVSDLGKEDDAKQNNANKQTDNTNKKKQTHNFPRGRN